MAAGAAAMLLAFPAAAQTIWKAHIYGPQRGPTAPFEWYAKEVAAKTGGRMKIEITYQKGKPQDAIDVLTSGSAEATFVCTTYFGDKMPLLTIVDLPMFAPESIRVLGSVELALADHPAIQAELGKWNTKMLLPVPLPQYQMMGTRRVVKLDDFKGAKLRISGEMGKVLQEYGAVVSVVAPTETAAALKSGTLDLVALPYPYAFAAYNVDGASMYVTEKISFGSQLCFIGVSRKSWDALPPDVQKVMLDLREPALAQYEVIYAREDAGHIAGFKQKGLEFSNFNSTDRARLLAKAVKVWEGWSEARENQGLKGREVFEFTQAKIRELSRRKQASQTP